MKGNHKNVSQPKGESGKFDRDTTKILQPPYAMSSGLSLMVYDTYLLHFINTLKISLEYKFSAHTR